MIVVMGGSGSGKSAYAEQLVMEQPERNRYYLATMRIYDAEGEKKVVRHRRMPGRKRIYHHRVSDGHCQKSSDGKRNGAFGMYVESGGKRTVLG